MLRDYRIILILSAGLLSGFGSWVLAGAETVGDASKGKPIYEKNCLICHGPEGRGDGPMGQSLHPPAPNFASPESQRKPDSEWMKVIREGHPDTAMTTWKGNLSDQQFLDVLAYARKLSRGVEKGRS
ncbi:MAG TPA: cytochrome c [Nitrospiria bacterium]|nr:cytochrome c [Nitrospiria bacterium]